MYDIVELHTIDGTIHKVGVHGVQEISLYDSTLYGVFIEEFVYYIPLHQIKHMLASRRSIGSE